MSVDTNVADVCTTLTDCADGSLRMRRHTSKPSMSGSLRSSTTRSGFSREMMVRASWPETASITRKPARSSSRVTM